MFNISPLSKGRSALLDNDPCCSLSSLFAWSIRMVVEYQRSRIIFTRMFNIGQKPTAQWAYHSKGQDSGGKRFFYHGMPSLPPESCRKTCRQAGEALAKVGNVISGKREPGRWGKGMEENQ